VLQLFPVTLCLTILKTTYIHFVKVTKPLLETSRRGYLAAISASSYSYVSLLQHFLPIMNPGSAYLLCYHAVASTIISHAKINTAVAAFFFLLTQRITVVYCLAIYNIFAKGPLALWLRLPSSTSSSRVRSPSGANFGLG
jgi:hypothetical protein